MCYERDNPNLTTLFLAEILSCRLLTWRSSYGVTHFTAGTAFTSQYTTPPNIVLCSLKHREGLKYKCAFSLSFRSIKIVFSCGFEIPSSPTTYLLPTGQTRREILNLLQPPANTYTTKHYIQKLKLFYCLSIHAAIQRHRTLGRFGILSLSSLVNEVSVFMRHRWKTQKMGYCLTRLHRGWMELKAPVYIHQVY
jgi:hypothetical protein